MRTYWLGVARRLSSLAMLLLLTACGGGGDGESPPGGVPPWTGNNNAAVVTTTNASKLAANVTGSDDTAKTIIGVSVESGEATRNRGSGLVDLARQLSRIVRDTVVAAEQASTAQRPVTAVIPVDQTVFCDFGNGTVRIFGTLNDNSTGTLQVSFTNCLIRRDKDGDVATNDSINLNGTATLRVDAVSSPFPSPTDFTLSFASLTLRGPGLSIDAGGTLRAQLSFGTTETITANLVSLNNSTSKMTKTENLMIVNVYDNLEMPSFSNTTINGRVFDEVHGYVDITTPTPLFFANVNQIYPSSGQMLLTGVGNRSIRITALSATLTRLQLDLDGDSVVDNTATLKWTDLSGPVGTDLGDTDGDGMHNSWETVNVLLPGTDDAALDKDGDTFTNLSEYMAGTNPSDINSHP